MPDANTSSAGCARPSTATPTASSASASGSGASRSSGSRSSRPPALVEETLREIGLDAEDAGSPSRACGPRRAAAQARARRFALLGELDGLVVAGHPIADRGDRRGPRMRPQRADRRAARRGHRPGRGAAPSTISPDGSSFFAVPAEEYGDVAWRVEQARAGRLEFLGGKPELLRLGHFDDVDLAMMIHATSQPEMKARPAWPRRTTAASCKTVRYLGRAAHAGGAPHLGVNALYAAHIGLAAINAIRETFRDEDSIRVHPIITHGGSQVNVIPADVRIETYVRGKTVEAILDANRQGRPGASRPARWPWGPRSRSRRCPATCRSSITGAWRGSSRPTPRRSSAPST